MGDLDVRAFLALYGGSRGPWAPEMLAFTVLGGGWAAIALLPLVLWTRTRRFGVGLSMAILTQASIVWLLKLAIGRVRPWLALGLPAPFGTPHDGSFPSGHAAGSFCVAGFVAMALPGLTSHSALRMRAVSWLALLGAAFVSLSRVYLGAHFPSDVVAGAVIGALVGMHRGRSLRGEGELPRNDESLRSVAAGAGGPRAGQ